MIALLRGRNTTVDVPDDVSDKQLSDINDNLPAYTNPPKEQAPAPTSQPSPSVENGTQPSTQAQPVQKWVPDFYNGYVKPLLDRAATSGRQLTDAFLNPEPLAVQAGEAEAKTPAGQVFAGKALEQATFGAAKPLVEPYIKAEVPEHPVAAFGGDLTGGLGSLLATSGALRIATGLPRIAAAAGQAAEATFAAASRFIPPAIMQGATFGTKTFIERTVKAFQDGNVDLEDFGKHVLGDTAAGLISGGISGIKGVATAISSAAGLGFVSAKLQGSDNRNATLQAAMWGLFEAVGGPGRSEKLNLEAIDRLSDTVGDHIEAMAEPGTLGTEGGKPMGKAFVDAEIKKQGFDSAEDLAKNGPENTLELIEGINQKVRNAQVLAKPPEPESGFKLLPDAEALAQGQKVESEVSKEQPLPKVGETTENPIQGAPPTTAPSPTPQPGTSTVRTKTPGEIFPLTDVSSDPSISQHPTYGQVTKDAAAITQHYAQQRGVEPTAELAEKVYREIHTDMHKVARSVITAPDDQKEAIAKQGKKELTAKYGDYENQFQTLAAKLWSDTSDSWFKNNVADQYGQDRPKMALDAEKAQNVPRRQLSTELPTPVQDAVNVYLIEHGETNIDAQDKNHGNLNPGINDKGVEQSQKVADALAPLNLNHVYNAGSQRALDTAKIIADANGAPTTAHEGLKAIDKGDQASGMKKDELKPILEKAFKQWADNPDQVLLGKESLTGAQERQIQAIKETVGKHKPGDRVGLVVNSDVAQLIRNMAENGGKPSTPEQIRSFRDKESIEPGDVSILKYHPDTGQIEIVKEKALAEKPQKTIKVDEHGIPIRKPGSVVSTVDLPSGEKIKITHNMILSEAKGMLQDAMDQRGVGELEQFMLDNPIRTSRTSDVKEEDRSIPVRFKDKNGASLDERAQQAFDRGLIDEPDSDLLRNALRDIPVRGEEPKLADFYDAAQRQLEQFYSSMEEEQAGNFSIAPTSKENVTDRFERLLKQATDQGLNPAQATKWAKAQLAGKPEANIEPKPKQQEFGSEGGVQSFGRGREGENEFNFSVVPKKEEQETIIKQVSDAVKESAEEIRNIVTPENAKPLAAEIGREELGKMARSYDRAEASLSEAKKYFDYQPKEANLSFIDKVEHGQDQEDPKLNQISKVLRKLLDDKRTEVQALGTGKLQSFIDNYFPHIWDQGEKQVGEAIQKAAKRPFEGGKSFLKKRTIEFTDDGIQMGLTPVSYNPVDLTLLKMREMDKYIMAHRWLNAYKENGLAQYVKIGKSAPDGWVKIDDRISTVMKSPMIAVQEAFDEKMMAQLNDVAKSLGIDLERKTSLGRHKGMPAGVWGFSESKPGTPGKITSKFAGPESVIAHELGHQLDDIYGLQQKFLTPESEKEFTALANQRVADMQKADPKFLQYIQKPTERMAVMLESYIHAPELFKQVAPDLFNKFESFLKSKPELEPLTKIKPSLVMGVGESEVHAGGIVIAGHIYAQPDAARIINNYLSPGLQKSKIYQVYRYAGNFINQFQLGFSAFHLGFTSVDAAVSKFALALNQLASGHPLKAIQNALETPFAPIQNIIRGDQLLNAWRGKGRSQMDEVLADAMATAGGRASMDQFYATKAYDQMKHNFQSGNFVRGLLHIPMALAEISSKPILEYIVPRQKLGVFADIMKMELENNPTMTHDQMRMIAQRAWNSVDNRMGQLVYDNLFWNRTFKDLLMGSVRSVGWNLGTLRELGGGGKDYAKATADVLQGKKPEFTYRMAYLAALPIIAGMLGAIYQYLRTGKGPQELKDYYFPRTGGTDASGEPNRVSFPSYMKDIYHYTEAPIKTVTNKLNPILSIISQMLENKDFYGTKIRNEDDPIVKQIAFEAKYALKQIEPFGFRNMQQQKKSGNSSLADIVGPWIGITPAPYDVNQTPAEKLARELAANHFEIGGRTQAQSDRSRLVSQLSREYKSDDKQGMNDIESSFKAGQISSKDIHDIIVRSNLTPLQKIVHGLDLDEMKRVYQKASPEEKFQIERMIQRKEFSQQRGRIPQEAQ